MYHIFMYSMDIGMYIYIYILYIFIYTAYISLIMGGPAQPFSHGLCVASLFNMWLGQLTNFLKDCIHNTHIYPIYIYRERERERYIYIYVQISRLKEWVDQPGHFLKESMYGA